MGNSHKWLAAGIFTIMISLGFFVGYMHGYDFNHRGPAVGSFTMAWIIISGAVAAIVLF